ncbi:hypothetical protein E2C01_044645 [Portunus trituberculatus]|uniref:Uncharacterized protein n=1 Tax=Portunus trituberculatus TaxID=210409 RepID=A0A5B7FTN6_PORTR|nr:hypothetical protein [Portunus trituberculatus]
MRGRTSDGRQQAKRHNEYSALGKAITYWISVPPSTTPQSLPLPATNEEANAYLLCVTDLISAYIQKHLALTTTIFRGRMTQVFGKEEEEEEEEELRWKKGEMLRY